MSLPVFSTVLLSYTSQYLWNTISSTPDVYLDELCLELEENHGVSIATSTIWRTLVKGGYSMKKARSQTNWAEYVTNSMFQLSRTALERSIEKRSMFTARIGTYEPNQLVFVDESAVDCCTTYRGRAWAIHGTKATRKAFFCQGKR